jgi:hypothetical protein
MVNATANDSTFFFSALHRHDGHHILIHMLSLIASNGCLCALLGYSIISRWRSPGFCTAGL